MGLFFGLLTIDLQFFTNSYPPENTKIKAEDFRILVGGPATNAAVTYAALAGETHLVTAVGQNLFRPYILGDLDQCRVKLYDLAAAMDRDPTFAAVINSPGGNRTIFSFHPPVLNSTTKNLKILPADPAFILIDGFYPEQAATVLDQYHSKNTIVIMDGGSWKPGVENLLSRTDILICSNHFFPPGTNNRQELLKQVKHYGIEKIAITNGAEPVFYQDGSETGNIRVPQVKAVDTLGAGDVFHGAFCYYIIQTGSFSTALEKSAEVAALSVQHSGTRTWLQHLST